MPKTAQSSNPQFPESPQAPCRRMNRRRPGRHRQSACTRHTSATRLYRMHRWAASSTHHLLHRWATDDTDKRETRAPSARISGAAYGTGLGKSGVGRLGGRIESCTNLPRPDSLPTPQPASSSRHISQAHNAERDKTMARSLNNASSAAWPVTKSVRHLRAPQLAPDGRASRGQNIMPPSCLSPSLHLFPAQVHRPPFTRHKPSTFLAPSLASFFRLPACLPDLFRLAAAGTPCIEPGKWTWR